MDIDAAVLPRKNIEAGTHQFVALQRLFSPFGRASKSTLPTGFYAARGSAPPGATAGACNLYVKNDAVCFLHLSSRIAWWPVANWERPPVWIQGSELLLKQGIWRMRWRRRLAREGFDAWILSRPTSSPRNHRHQSLARKRYGSRATHSS